jgi:hypothetical protein
MSELITYVLAVWRLAHMVVKEDGPGDVFRWLRDADDFVRPAPLSRGVVKALNCVSCASIWAAGFLLIVDRTPFRWLRWVLAGSAVAKLLEDYFYESAGEVIEEGTSSSVSPFVPSEYWMAGRE